jgi:hypothetical protein
VNPKRLRERARETLCPADLSLRVLHLILSKLDLQIRQVQSKRMEGDAVVDGRLHRIRLIVSHLDVVYIIRPAQDIHNWLHQAAILMTRECDLPGPVAPRKIVSHGMNRERDGRRSTRSALIKNGFDRRVVRLEPAFNALRSGGRREVQVAGNHGAVAAFGNEIRRIQVTIAIDHQPGYRAEHRRCVEDARQSLGHSGGADVPCDVAGKFSSRQTEIVELRRNMPAGVIAENHELAATLGPKDSWIQAAVPGVTLTETSIPKNAEAGPT